MVTLIPSSTKAISHDWVRHVELLSSPLSPNVIDGESELIRYYLTTLCPCWTEGGYMIHIPV